jgi:hypothetical protein
MGARLDSRSRWIRRVLRNFSATNREDTVDEKSNDDNGKDGE